MANVVVIGAGLGGLPVAYELRHLLPKEHTVTLVSEHSQFTFIPGLIRVALDLAPLDHVQLEVEELAEKFGINWVSSRVSRLDAKGKQLIMENGQVIHYDYAAIATGASLAFHLVPGLGPHGGYTQSVCTADHAMQAREEWLKFLENPGPLVVGAAPGAGCFGPAYEFVLMADWELRQRGIRDQVKITYVTPEPYTGHLGVSKVKNAEKLTADLLEKRGIEVVCNAEITHVDPENINLKDGRKFPFKYSMVLPAFQGVKFVREAEGVGNAKGFVPVLPTYRHPEYDSIYALGVAVQLDQPDKTPVPIGLPKSGQMTEAMGMAVAHNIAVDLGAIKKPLMMPTLQALCFAEFGNTGIAYIAVPVLPDPVTKKRIYSYAVRGLWIKWVKEAFEAYFMVKMRRGMAVPWFERLGLRILFGLSLVKPLPEAQAQELLCSDSSQEMSSKTAKSEQQQLVDRT
jgi:sulfide:quinone oxidoreductase